MPAGVGLAFALACDLILVSERALLVPAFGRIGLLPEVGRSWQLTRRLGYQRSFELFAGGRHLSGAEAAELGLANSVHPHEELLPAAHECCERIEALPGHVATMMKPPLRHAADLTGSRRSRWRSSRSPAASPRPSTASVAALLTGD